MSSLKFSNYQEEYKKSFEDLEKFWEEKANFFMWKKRWDVVLDNKDELFNSKWFVNGKLNITENCLDRHLEFFSNKKAIIWESNNSNEENIILTYKELHNQVCKFANVLKKKGLKKGDIVTIYLPMVPEMIISVLACARIGVIHSVVFAGFSVKALSDRINDVESKLIITANGGYRGNKTLYFKNIVDETLEDCPTIKNVIIVNRIADLNVNIIEGRDSFWEDEMNEVSDECNSVEMDSEDPLFVLYTSGSTGKPKGLVHTIGGYMVQTQYSFENVFDYKMDDIFWCTADVGWITGHSYVVYGPLLAGATIVLFEGIPTFPNPSRFWQIVEKHNVNIFYTAPTALRVLKGENLDFIKKYDLSSLRVLGSVGEPIDEETWHWYFENIGNKNCKIVDTWWQTETGSIMISPFSKLEELKPTFATNPLPGIFPVIVDDDGNEVNGDIQGNLCIKYPWPSMARSIWNNKQRYFETYFSKFRNYYSSGDKALKDSLDRFRILGRSDDIINVSAHCLSTAEIENVIDEHKIVVESAVVGFPHKIKGEGICAFVICNSLIELEDLKLEVNTLLSKVLGPITKLDKIYLVTDLPKTRSGKIMRRILKKIILSEFENLGDLSSLSNPDSIGKIIKQVNL